MSVNKVILLGNVGGDPDIRYHDSKTIISSFSLATSESRGVSGGEITDWHKIVVYGETAKFVERYVRKGTKLYLEGKIKYREFEDKFKIRHKVTEIIADKIEILGRSIN